MSDHEPGKKRTLYDYSRSDSGSHWYSGGEVPLSRKEAASPKPEAYKPDREKTALPARDSRTRQRVERRRRVQTTTPNGNWAVILIAGVIFGLTAILAALLVFVFSNDDKNTGSANAAALIEPTSEIYADGSALEGNAMLISPWEGEERFTVLLMGMDVRPDQSSLECRTDTIMVLSIDPDSQGIGILSIPRDTFVEVPGYGLRQINTACVIGNLEQPGYGPRLTMQTIQYNFGIAVNDYVLLNFDAFRNIIDAIGGINVYVEETINDLEYPDEYYGFDPFYIEAGWHLMDGETALKYARTRKTTDDIDRGRRQQQIIFAVRDKVLSLGMIDDLALQALPIWREIEAGVETELGFNQMVELALYAAEIDLGNINNAVLDWQYLRPIILEDGREVLIPDRAALAELMTSVFGANYNR